MRRSKQYLRGGLEGVEEHTFHFFPKLPWGIMSEGMRETRTFLQQISLYMERSIRNYHYTLANISHYFPKCHVFFCLLLFSHQLSYQKCPFNHHRLSQFHSSLKIRQNSTSSVECSTEILGWPKSSFRFFHKMLQKNRNELFGQPNISLCKLSFCQGHIHSELPQQLSKAWLSLRITCGRF